MGLIDFPYGVTEALIGYLKSQTAFNEAAIQRMADDRRQQAKREEMLEELKKQMQAGPSVLGLGDLLGPDEEDEL